MAEQHDLRRYGLCLRRLAYRAALAGEGAGQRAGASRSIASRHVPSARSAAPGGLSLQQEHDDLLDFALVSGKRIVETALTRAITIDEGNSAAALEVMTRYAVNPKWLIHLPPTMAPAATSKREGILEHPDEAFDYFRSEGVFEVVIEEKHMGSRALIVVCRDEDAARQWFGVATGETGHDL